MAEKCERVDCVARRPEITASACVYDITTRCPQFTTTPSQSITVERLNELEEREQKGLGACMMVQSQAKTIERLAGEVERANGLLKESLPILFDVGVEGVSGGWLQLSPLDFKVSKLLKDVEKCLCDIEGQELPSKKGRPFNPPVCQHNIPISQGCKECARGRQCG